MANPGLGLVFRIELLEARHTRSQEKAFPLRSPSTTDIPLQAPLMFPTNSPAQALARMSLLPPELRNAVNSQERPTAPSIKVCVAPGVAGLGPFCISQTISLPSWGRVWLSALVQISMPAATHDLPAAQWESCLAQQGRERSVQRGSSAANALPHRRLHRPGGVAPQLTQAQQCTARPAALATHPNCTPPQIPKQLWEWQCINLCLPPSSYPTGGESVVEALCARPLEACKLWAAGHGSGAPAADTHLRRPSSSGGGDQQQRRRQWQQQAGGRRRRVLSCPTLGLQQVEVRGTGGRYMCGVGGGVGQLAATLPEHATCAVRVYAHACASPLLHAPPALQERRNSVCVAEVLLRRPAAGAAGGGWKPRAQPPAAHALAANSNGLKVHGGQRQASDTDSSGGSAEGSSVGSGSGGALGGLEVATPVLRAGRSTSDAQLALAALEGERPRAAAATAGRGLYNKPFDPTPVEFCSQCSK